jgi:outer membrane protein TolC
MAAATTRDSIGRSLASCTVLMLGRYRKSLGSEHLTEAPEPSLPMHTVGSFKSALPNASTLRAMQCTRRVARSTMNRPTVFLLPAALWLGLVGCAHLKSREEPTSEAPSATKSDSTVKVTAHQSGDAGPAHRPATIAAEFETAPIGREFNGPQPVDVYIRRALDENRLVRAAKFSVLALKHRIPQVTSLDDPVISNTIFPIPSVAPQFFLMGYMPYNALLAQQFPWFGTLRLRLQAAEEDVKVALMELAAAQLDVVAAVKRAYYDLHFNERAETLLRQNRALAVDFLELAGQRYKTGTVTQVDVIRSQVAVSDIDRELENIRQGLNEARADLARQVHLNPETELRTLSELPRADVPAEVERLYQLAVASRPNLRGRLAAIARDEKAVELARKRFYPNLTLGVVYQDMEKTNAVSPRTASGMPNVGLFVGLNLPVYHRKYRAGVCEAQARLAADAQLYEDERDQAQRDVKDLFVQARVQQNVVGLLNRSNLPAAKQVFELTTSAFRAANAGVDYLSVLNAWRDVLQVELQIAQVEAELGKTLASLERAVGVQLNEHPPDSPSTTTGPSDSGSAPPPLRSPGPFRREDQSAVPEDAKRAPARPIQDIKNLPASNPEGG